MKRVFYTSLHNLVILCIPQFSSADIVSIDSLSTQEALPFFIVFVPFSTLFLEFLIVGLLHLEFSNNNFTYSVHAFIPPPPPLQVQLSFLIYESSDSGISCLNGYFRLSLSAFALYADSLPLLLNLYIRCKTTAIFHDCQ